MTGFEAFIALAALAVSLSLIMTGSWLVWRASGNSGWVDTIWTFGLGTVGLGCALLAAGDNTRRIVVGSLVAVWSFRLGLHIARRTAGIVDDPRYADLAKDWGEDTSRQMFWLLQKQAVVSIPLAFSNTPRCVKSIFVVSHAGFSCDSRLCDCDRRRSTCG